MFFFLFHIIIEGKCGWNNVGGGGGAKGMLAPLSNYWGGGGGGAGPPGPPLPTPMRICWTKPIPGIGYVMQNQFLAKVMLNKTL